MNMLIRVSKDFAEKTEKILEHIEMEADIIGVGGFYYERLSVMVGPAEHEYFLVYDLNRNEFEDTLFDAGIIYRLIRF